MRVSRLAPGRAEIFASIQGEGPTAGTPSVFARLALCNLRCSWCDSRYTWDWDRHDLAEETVELGAEAVVEAVVDRAGDHVRNVVLTGGEPMLQPEALERLAASLTDRGFRIEVETNGTVRPGPRLERLVDQWNVSPKLASSGNRGRRREVPDALTRFATLPSAYWKFVVTSEEDVPEVEALVGRYGVPAERVFLMPEATDAGTLAERSRWLAEVCRDTGYRLGTRLHVLLWGTERGR